ncbi:hypothetical protein M0813_07405 [Anaeramoeba flamelloides]|uniref:Uncharacterized protein n=1 Tax=Anaeramoeba flamelloides TaxID=1746091 RepID=A0ABQ8XCP1_9EUKA|nr:hypothetical protein M0813_07405 [Anaeramoeba flamelloides]
MNLPLNHSPRKSNQFRAIRIKSYNKRSSPLHEEQPIKKFKPYRKKKAFSYYLNSIQSKLNSEIGILIIIMTLFLVLTGTTVWVRMKAKKKHTILQKKIPLNGSTMAENNQQQPSNEKNSPHLQKNDNSRKQSQKKSDNPTNTNQQKTIKV